MPLVMDRASTGIFVTSLRNGAGTTHFSMAIATVVARLNDVPVGYCYQKSLPASIQKNKKIIPCPAVDLGNIVGQFRYNVIEGGVLNELPDEMMKELKRSQYKIMLCLSDDNYLADLARFVHGLGNAVGEWCFVFNTVPESKKSAVRQLMKKYHYVIAPEFIATNPDPAAEDMFRKIFLRR